MICEFLSPHCEYAVEYVCYHRHCIHWTRSFNVLFNTGKLFFLVTMHFQWKYCIILHLQTELGYVCAYNMCFEIAFAYNFVEFSMIYPYIAVISVGKSRTTETGNRTICFDCFVYGSMSEKKCKYFLIWPQKRYFFCKSFVYQCVNNLVFVFWGHFVSLWCDAMWNVK